MEKPILWREIGTMLAKGFAPIGFVGAWGSAFYYIGDASPLAVIIWAIAVMLSIGVWLAHSIFKDKIAQWEREQRMKDLI